MENEKRAESQSVEAAELLDENKAILGHIDALIPNIIFVRKVELKDAKTGEMKTVDAEPPRAIHTVGASFKLPPAAEQLKGFYHEDAARIIREMPEFYKPLTAKGAK